MLYLLETILLIIMEEFHHVGSNYNSVQWHIQNGGLIKITPKT